MGKATESVRLTAFVLVIVGTLGLLANEYIGNWGRAATLASAALNVVGLMILWVSLPRDRKRPPT